MLVKVVNLKMAYDYQEAALIQKLVKLLRLDHKDQILSYRILKFSVDARKKQQITKLYTLEVDVEGACHMDHKQVFPVEAAEGYQVPFVKRGTYRPVIVGSGPAGLFCGLILAEAGLAPIILEQGSDVDTRISDTEQFFKTGKLNQLSNIQFGEGGAGTFSDGKLNSGVKDKFYRKDKILNTFVDAGAPEEILYNNKPHIGTDYLIIVVKNMRQKIEALGGSVLFGHKFVDFKQEDGCLAIRVETRDEKAYDIKTNHLVLAIGHSARDTFELLKQKAVPMEQKPFAMGLRIEHLQQQINEAQYGETADMSHLPVADYKLTYQTKKGRSVYSFCMCPGGYVVNSASEDGRLVCNGMSNFKRDERNANAAVLVNVKPEDYDNSSVLNGGVLSGDVLAGIAFQRYWEEQAFKLTGGSYALPVQRFEDFKKGVISQSFGHITPNIKGSFEMANLNDCLPTFISEAIKEAIPAFCHRIKGYDDPDAVLTGIESRSSSPVRILRDENFSSTVQGVYPCGEGAGYAGGIMSAAIDGIKVAEAIISKHLEP